MWLSGTTALPRRASTLPFPAPPSRLARLSSSTSRAVLRPNHAPFPKRSHNCGALSSNHVGSRVVLAGWLLPERKLSKSLSFFPLRDSYGTTQLVVQSQANPDSHAQSSGLAEALADVPVESTVLIQGQVRLRPEKQRRPDPAGEIEVVVTDFTLLNPADRHMPFLPSDSQNLANEDLRSQYRYLDLRRPQLSANLRKRSQVANIVRSVLSQQDFLEVETPILLKSTPEGAPPLLRSPAVPSAAQATSYCSGGVDRYYQLARCFRDEDGRKDRQPEFTQIDLEMAFVSWGGPSQGDDPWRIGGSEVRDVVEDIVREVWAQMEKVSLPDRFRVMSYDEAMRRFGSDKPDTRFGLEIVDVSSCLPASAVTAAWDSGETVGCLAVRQSDDTAFHPIAVDCPIEDRLDRVVITPENVSSWLADCPIVRGLSSHGGHQHGSRQLDKTLPVKPGDVVWIGKQAIRAEGGSTALGRQRLRLAERAQQHGTYTPTREPHFLWITEFPLFTRADPEKDALLAQGRWSSTHHPFTAPAWQDVQALYEGRISEIRGQHYDLVLNGVEIGGGSVRVHDAMMQEHIFSEVLQLDAHEKASFNHLLHALKCGAPPHAGIALGLDRMVAILCNASSIRDVIAFPKTSAGTDALFKSPAPVNKDVLHQYGIRPL
ncbi:tRNA synthetases class II-domain-containing protein [Gloeopeniophorella convolvens]|nr:tRNA synthetases class II-domain-containing protein [Gloeopeniophorella convolvens]